MRFPSFAPEQHEPFDEFDQLRGRRRIPGVRNRPAQRQPAPGGQEPPGVPPRPAVGRRRRQGLPNPPRGIGGTSLSRTLLQQHSSLALLPRIAKGPVYCPDRDVEFSDAGSGGGTRPPRAQQEVRGGSRETSGKYEQRGARILTNSATRFPGTCRLPATPFLRLATNHREAVMTRGEKQGTVFARALARGGTVQPRICRQTGSFLVKQVKENVPCCVDTSFQ